jgi:hypothetical protein
MTSATPRAYCVGFAVMKCGYVTYANPTRLVPRASHTCLTINNPRAIQSVFCRDIVYFYVFSTKMEDCFQSQLALRYQLPPLLA